jgi:hypothetical protein
MHAGGDDANGIYCSGVFGAGWILDGGFSGARSTEDGEGVPSRMASQQGYF